MRFNTEFLPYFLVYVNILDFYLASLVLCGYPNGPRGLFFKPLYMDKLINYLKGAIAEMRKVTWPTKKETYNYTVLVIAASLATAVFLGGLDYLFNLGVEWIINR